MQANLARLVRVPLFWLAVLYVSVGAVYALVTPMFEKHDEDGHYGYILYLREHHALPPLTFSEGFPSEYKQPPLYYVFTAVLTSWLPDDVDPDCLLVTNPYMDFSVPGYRNDNRNVFLHPPHMTPLVLGGRLVSLSFGLGTMIVSYYLALQLFDKHSLVPIATAAVAGFHPKFLYIATAVNNDAATAFFGALVVTLLLRRLAAPPSQFTVRDSRFPTFAVSTGCLLGLACITKVSALVFFPLTALALLLSHRNARRAMIRDGVIIALVALLVGGWWYARNALLYGDPLSIGTHTVSSTATRSLWGKLEHDLSSIEHTFWANPSRTFVSQMRLDRVPIWWGRVSLCFLALGFLFNRLSRASRLTHHVSRFTLHVSRPSSHIWIVLLSWPTAFFILLVTYWTREGSWAYGRLLFPAIAPTALLFVLGWLYAFPWGWKRLILSFGAGVIVIASAMVPFLSIYPLYHPWHTWGWEEGQVKYPVGAVYVEPGTGIQVAELVGYGLPEPFALPGAYLPVDLRWKPLAQTEARYAVFVHLLDLSQLDIYGSPGIWGSRRTYPGLGNLPTDRWTPGRTFQDRVLVNVSPDTPTPLAAAIEIGFIDPETGVRLQAVNSENEPLDMPVFRGVPILAADSLLAVERPASYVLDGAIGFEQVLLSGSAGDTITLTLTWRSLQPVSYDATTFVHLRSTDGALLAQADRQPLDGRFPTSHWLPGQVITDVVSLSPVDDAHAETFVVHIGMYTWPSLERLPVVDGSGTPQRDNVIAISVSPVGAPEANP